MKSKLMLVIFIVLTVQLIHGSIKFHSLLCEVLEKEFLTMAECRIRAIDRTHNSMNIRANLKKTLTSFQVKFQFYKRERGGWHPFLYGMTIDVCKFFLNPKRYPIPSLVFYYLKDFTNVNHTCPFATNTSLNLLEWQPDEANFLSRFPLDMGQYALNTVWYAEKKRVLCMNGSIDFF